MKPRVALVNPPNHEYDRFELAPPLGLLVLADVALSEGFEAKLFDYSLPRYDAITNDIGSFYDSAADEILDFAPRLTLFTSMCLNTHVSLLLAKRLRELSPETLIVVGGPHFSAISDETQSNYPWVDATVVGEGEDALRRILADISKPATQLPRATYSGASFVSAPRHPQAAYDLVDLEEYFHANPRKVLNYEGGKGCVYKCKFCYSPSFYNAARDAPAEQIVSDWKALEARGAKHLFDVQDNLTNHPQNALAVCKALADSNPSLSFNCYATLPQLSEPIIEALASAGCNSVYLGVDAVSANQQRLYGKHFFRNDSRLAGTIARCRSCFILPTCAFIIDMFNQKTNDVEAVLRTATLCAMAGAAIRINVLTRYPGSAIENRFIEKARYSDLKPRILLDCPAVVTENSLAVEHPSLFPFHATEVSEAGWLLRLRMSHVAQNVIQSLPDEVAEIAPTGDHALTDFFFNLARELPIPDEPDKRSWKPLERDLFRSTLDRCYSKPPPDTIGAVA